MQTSSFLFVFCQVGVEALLKRELVQQYPQLKFSFSRPGFCTFKNSEPMGVGFQLSSVFAQSYGLSLGRLESEPSSALLRSKFSELLDRAQLQIHVVARELRSIDGLENHLILDEWKVNQEPKDGDLVMTLMEIDPGQWWVGIHRHALFRSPFPGGRMSSTLPSEAPSRAYLKMKEALAWSRAPVRSNDVAVEFGSAPGGSCYALLQAGLRVVGVDRAQMDLKILEHPRYRHLSRSLNILKRSDFPSQVHWFAIDMNISMDQALPIVEKYVALFRSSLVGVLLTFKLNNHRYANSIPNLIMRLKKCGFHTLKAVQLSSHHSEVLVYGLLQ
jgi:23S rRNA (cytidine2498-2'-O)-methyltransferase